MAHYSSPEAVQIVGIEADNHGRSCEDHAYCGEVLQEDVVVRLWRVQVLIGGKGETAIAKVWVTDGIEHCRVGFLQRHLVKHARRYNSALAQVTRVLSASGGNTVD